MKKLYLLRCAYNFVQPHHRHNLAWITRSGGIGNPPTLIQILTEAQYHVTERKFTSNPPPQLWCPTPNTPFWISSPSVRISPRLSSPPKLAIWQRDTTYNKSYDPPWQQRYCHQHELISMTRWTTIVALIGHYILHTAYCMRTAYVSKKWDGDGCGFGLVLVVLCHAGISQWQCTGWCHSTLMPHDNEYYKITVSIPYCFLGLVLLQLQGSLSRCLLIYCMTDGLWWGRICFVLMCHMTCVSFTLGNRYQDPGVYFISAAPVLLWHLDVYKVLCTFLIPLWWPIPGPYHTLNFHWASAFLTR